MAELGNGNIHADGIGIAKRDMTINANTNNFDIGMSSFVAITNDFAGTVNITGLLLAGHTAEIVHEIKILNISVNSISFQNDDSLSAVGNRIFTKSGADVVLGQWECITLHHIDFSGRHGWAEI